MDFFNVLTLIGGLALFLYGMDLMGTSLTIVSGNRLKSILENLTSNRLKAVLLGAGVTAVIQSSTATTVMVVGLVNSGIMKLKQAIAIIMGANIGTTITSWILSLAGLESSNFFIRLLKPTSFSPILGVIGVVWLMFSKSERRHSFGKIMIGFAILMFGMDTMSGAMEPLANSPDFQQLFLHFSNPVLGILAGAALTAVIQSSSASVGILQALCSTGLVTYSAAIPIIMGQNIGTCITAAISAVGAKRNAKRAALAHLLFNLIGTLLFTGVFYITDAFVHFAFVDDLASPVSVAIIHSIFNISNTLLLINFTGALEKLVKKILPETKDELSEELSTFAVLDDRLLETPSVALEQAYTLSLQMFEIACESVDHSLSLLDGFKRDIYKLVKKQEKKIDKYQDALNSYLIKIGKEKMTEVDNRRLTIVLNSINEFERISDHALAIAESLQVMEENQQHFSTQAFEELSVYRRAVNDILALTRSAYTSRSEADATRIEPLEEVIDRLHEALKIRHIERLRNGQCSVELGVILTDITTSMERISDHCSNVAVAIIEIQHGAFDPHRYLKKLKKASNLEFQTMYEGYLEQFPLPEDNALSRVQYAVEGDVLGSPAARVDK